MTGGQGVAGSNPAVPTGSEVFSNILTPHKSQQKSQLVVQRPFNRRAPIGCHGLLTGMCQHRRADQPPQPTSQRSPSRPTSARRPRQPRTGRRHPRPPAVQHPRDASRPRASSQACPRRRRREAADMESRPSDGPPRLQRLHRSAPPPGHRLHPRYGESAIQISSPCDARTNELPDFKASGTAKCLPVISTQNADYECLVK